ncbi:DUF308 domain-containing protein [Psychromicrobium xiongbiense]|uniref:DUF308 domain-containing protein n=1 Tax=Psychromicrobium xiongbiense TaxID=3051184 RepID=UPI0025553F51|nr:DUF308 domain-containing protein [Psychromicrobium sp. YIM S02556]
MSSASASHPTSSPKAAKPTPELELWKPVLFRAVVALLFGLLSVFWPDMPQLIRGLVTGVYFVASGLAVFTLHRTAQRSRTSSRTLFGPWLLLESALWLVGGIAVALAWSGELFIVLAAVTLLAAGVMEFLLGLQFRQRTVLGRDWLITGTVGLLGGVILLLLGHAAARAPIGVLGGVAVVIGVVLLLAALSYRHDARSEAVPVKQSGNNSSLPGVE